MYSTHVAVVTKLDSGEIEVFETVNTAKKYYSMLTSNKHTVGSDDQGNSYLLTDAERDGGAETSNLKVKLHMMKMQTRFSAAWYHQQLLRWQKELRSGGVNDLVARAVAQEIDRRFLDYREE